MAKEKYLSFRGKPLVRSGNIMYYGDITDPYITLLQISDTSNFEDMELPSKVSIQLLSTDESLPVLERIKKNSERKSIADALDIASIWLDRSLSE